MPKVFREGHSTMLRVPAAEDQALIQLSREVVVGKHC